MLHAKLEVTALLETASWTTSYMASCSQVYFGVWM